MKKVRPITWVGLLLGVIALFVIPYSLPAAIVIGACGMVVSTIALVTSPGNYEDW